MPPCQAPPRRLSVHHLLIICRKIIFYFTSSIINEVTHIRVAMTKKTIKPNSISTSLIDYYPMPFVSPTFVRALPHYNIMLKSDFSFTIFIRKEDGKWLRDQLMQGKICETDSPPATERNRCGPRSSPAGIVQQDRNGRQG